MTAAPALRPAQRAAMSLAPHSAARDDAPMTAIHLAVARARAHPVQRHPVRALPQGMLQLIRLAAGDDALLERATQDTQAEPQLVRDAVALFLEQQLTRKDSSDHHLLCLNPGATIDELRAHKRALLMWLHPDRNNSPWQSALFQRVQAAAQRLEHGGLPLAGDTAPAASPVAPANGAHGARVKRRHSGSLGRSHGSARQPHRRKHMDWSTWRLFIFRVIGIGSFIYVALSLHTQAQAAGGWISWVSQWL